MLGNGADRNYCSPNGFSPPLVASLQGHETLAKIFLKNKGNVNICGLYLVSPLYAPCRKGYNHIESILHDDAEVNVWFEGGFSPLYIACLNEPDDVVKILLHTVR